MFLLLIVSFHWTLALIKMSYCKLTYYNAANLGGIYYEGGFQQMIYLRITEEFPKFELEEEGEENVKGIFIPTYQLVKYRYSFITYCHVYLAEALMLLRLHDTVEIVTSKGLWGQMKDIIVETPDELEVGCLAMVRVSFGIVNNDVIKSDCYGT